jgi:hypothetical protein
MGGVAFERTHAVELVHDADMDFLFVHVWTDQDSTTSLQY